MPYDYKTSMIHDIKNFMEDTNSFNINEYETLDELKDRFMDWLFDDDMDDIKDDFNANRERIEEESENDTEE